MAEHLLRSFDPELDIFSAGTEPGKMINLRTVKVMAEIGIDVSISRPRKLDCFVTSPFDYVITVCDDAREKCPVFQGMVKNRLHIGFEDPAMATGTEEEVMNVYRKIRDQINTKFREFYHHIKNNTHD
jgi:arsenate reductase